MLNMIPKLRTVLVVDRDPAIRRLLRIALERRQPFVGGQGGNEALIGVLCKASRDIISRNPIFMLPDILSGSDSTAAAIR